MNYYNSKDIVARSVYEALTSLGNDYAWTMTITQDGLGAYSVDLTTSGSSDATVTQIVSSEQQSISEEGQSTLSPSVSQGVAVPVPDVLEVNNPAPADAGLN